MDIPNSEITGNKGGFSEEEWLKILFLLSDTHIWLDDLSKRTILQLPISSPKKLFRKTHFITAPALAHILERHYCKIPRHPGTSKFTIPIIEIVQHLRDASSLPSSPIPGTVLFKRVINTGNIVGFNKNGQNTTTITVITDGGGQIITAFPDLLNR